MSIKWQAFRAAAHLLRKTGADHILGRRYAGRGAIFVLHSVVPDRRAHLLERLRTSATFLDRILSDLRDDGVDIVSLVEAVERLQTDRQDRFACFTFDDGFRDNLTVAQPIFEKHGAPFTVFVTTCLLNHTIDNWWNGVAEIVRQNERIDIDSLDQNYDCANFQEKVAAYEAIKRAVGEKRLTQEGLEQLLRKYRVDMNEINARDALSIEELRELAVCRNVEIGAHTTSHPHLAKMDADAARIDIAENKKWLEELLDRPVTHFAYPYGGPESCNEREVEIVKELGFRTAVTTRLGNLFPDHIRSLHALPRLRFFSEYENMDLISFQRSGGANALLTGFGNPVVTI